MHPFFDISAPSPDAQHMAYLAFSGEIRFGPAYYALSVDDYTFGPRIFGSPYQWSSSSDLLAVQEWLTLDYSAGPITALLVIHVQLRQEITVAQATKRFLVPTAFTGTTILYREEHAGQEVFKHFDLETATRQAWKAFA